MIPEVGDPLIVMDAFDDNFSCSMTTDATLLYVRNIVQEMRKLCSFIKNSTKCIERIEKIQKELDDYEHCLKVNMDVRTRWNSTLAMLNRMLKLQEPVTQFLAFYHSAAGKKEF